jgi:hypothetical protein
VASLSFKSPNEVLRAVIKESDRGCVLVCAAWVEDMLREMISNEIEFMRDIRGLHPISPKDYDSYLRSLLDGALNRAGNRVAFCRVAGFVDESTADALTALFLMRNEYFAHFAGVSRLNDKRLTQRLKEFTDSVVPQGSKKAFSGTLRRKSYSKARCKFMDAYSDLVIIGKKREKGVRTI